MDFSLEDYKKYKWFCTKSGKLVVGGKSAEQNDQLISHIKSLEQEFVVMHTERPGSPFSVILALPEKVSKEDLEETAVFTASFSKAWKLGAKKAIIHIFRAHQLKKSKLMKAGTWGLSGKIQKVAADVKLVLTVQKKVLRAVPELSVKSKKDILLTIVPGKIQKTDLLNTLNIKLKKKFSQDEILSALPTGGIEII